jgi:hypothetical protein
MIDKMQMYEYNRTKYQSNNDKTVFDIEVYNSILNQTASMYKENSKLLKKKSNQISSEYTYNSHESLEHLINKITQAETGITVETKKKFFLFKSGNNTTGVSINHDQPEKRTIEFTTNTKALDGLTKRLHIKNKSDAKIITKIADLTNMKSIREKIAESLKNKYKENSKPKSKPDSAIPTHNGHKSTLSMPKLTNNIFYIINQNPQLNTQITIYQNVDNNKPLSSRIKKEINNNTFTGKKTPTFVAEKKKDYKKLLRPDMFEVKKSPFEVKITKVQSKNKLNFAEENRLSKDQSTTRNVI